MHVRALPTLAALQLAACSYSFSNPAEDLQLGQVSGRVLVDRQGSGTLEAFGGVAVSLRGSAFDQVTHDTGRFTVLPLPAGRHTLLFRRNTVWALERDVEIAYGRDGQPEGVSLGDVVLRYSAAVSGTVAPPTSLVPTVLEGVALDETTGETAPIVGGTFTFPVLPLGAHRFTVAIRDAASGLQWVGGPILITLGDQDQQTEKRLAPVPIHDAGSLGLGTGRIRFRVSSVGLSVDPATATVAGLPAGSVSGPDSNGDFEASVPEGVYAIAISPPGTALGALAPAVATAVAITNQLADLGTLYLVLDSSVSKAQAACASAADCGGGPCLSGACSDWIPPPAAPAGTPFCDQTRSSCQGPGAPCPAPGGFPGSCAAAAAGTGLGTCLRCGTCCTPDGATTLCAPLGAGGCGVVP